VLEGNWFSTVVLEYNVPEPLIHPMGHPFQRMTSDSTESPELQMGEMMVPQREFGVQFAKEA
jgi:hypothetical protein